MIKIDGAYGEGGGQILRTSLSLSMLTGQAVQINHIRSRRRKPGLLRQHLTAVNAAAAISGAITSGAVIDSSELTFSPQCIKSGKYHFAVGTAGSTLLVLQTILPALLAADSPSEVVIEGGTHNSGAPTFDYFAQVFLPVLRRMGGLVEARLQRYGFYPAGSGRIKVDIQPSKLQPHDLTERGALQRQQVIGLTANLPEKIALQEAQLVATAWTDHPKISVAEVESSGPGNVLMLEQEYEHITEMFIGFGELKVPREEVARRVIEQARRYQHALGPAGPYLADQLLLPLALAGGGSLRTVAHTQHTETNLAVIGKFLPLQYKCREIGRDDWEIKLNA